jgi:hypothetical protein
MRTGRRSGLREYSFMRTDGQQVIGMLGGMSWESSAHYYRLANELVRDEPSSALPVCRAASNNV